jgi:hypothetical protein
MKKLIGLITILLSANLFAQSDDIQCQSGTQKIHELNQLIPLAEKIIDQNRATVPQVLEDVANRLTNLSHCPEKVWPDNKINNTSLRMSVPKDDAVYLYDLEKGKFEFDRELTEKDKTIQSFDSDIDGDGGMFVNAGRYAASPPPPSAKKEAPKAPPSGAGPKFCKSEYTAYNALLAGTDPTVEKTSMSDRLFAFTTHETFHKVDQSPGNSIHNHTGACKWNADGVQQRSIGGDTSGFALGRQHIMKYLMQAYDAPKGSSERKKYLGLVKSWQEKLSKEYPEEYKIFSKVDRSEGIAEYAGVMSNVFGTLGCNPSEADKKKLIQKHIKNRYIDMVQALDMQSYLVGAISGFILDEEAKDNSAWKNTVTKTKIAPLDLLSKEKIYKEAPTTNGPTKNEAIMNSIPVADALDKCKNNEVAKAVSPILNHEEEYVLVEAEKIPFGTGGGFITYETPSKEEIIVSLASTSQGINLKISDRPIIKIKNLCGSGNGGTNFIAVPKRYITDEGLIQGDDNFKVSGKIKINATEEKWEKHQVACQS